MQVGSEVLLALLKVEMPMLFALEKYVVIFFPRFCNVTKLITV